MFIGAGSVSYISLYKIARDYANISQKLFFSFSNSPYNENNIQ